MYIYEEALLVEFKTIGVFMSLHINLLFVWSCSFLCMSEHRLLTYKLRA